VGKAEAAEISEAKIADIADSNSFGADTDGFNMSAFLMRPNGVK